MSSIANGREIYVLGKEEYGNREVVIVESGEVHDLPAAAINTYDSELTKFPYSI